MSDLSYIRTTESSNVGVAPTKCGHFYYSVVASNDDCSNTTKLDKRYSTIDCDEFICQCIDTLWSNIVFGISHATNDGSREC